MKMKRTLFLLVALCALALFVLPGTAHAADIASGACGGNATWTFNDEGVLTISGSGPVIYAPWKGEYQTDIKEVIIEEGITSFQDRPFEYCTNLTEVSLPSTLKTIGEYSFDGCSRLETLVLPEGLIDIGGGAFMDTGIKNLTLPSTLLEKDYSLFQFKYEIENLYISDLRHFCSLNKNTSDFNFRNLYLNGELVTDLVIPDTVTAINDTFRGWEALETVYIPDSVTTIGMFAFSDCPNLRSVRLPERLVMIPDHCFDGCSSLSEITIPASVKVINASAFAGWYHANELTTIRFMGNAPLIAPDAFYGIEATVYYSADNASWTDEVRQNYGVGTLTWVADSTIPDTGDTEVVELASGSCGDHTSWNLNSKGVLTISGTGETTSSPWRDSYKSIIKELIVEDGVTSLCPEAFEFCMSLISVRLPETLSVIPELCFSSCNSLPGITIPASVKFIDFGAFALSDEGSQLSTIRFLGNAPLIASNAFNHTSATAYYSADSSTWTAEICQNYGGFLRWVADESIPAVAVKEIVDSGNCGENVTWSLNNRGILTISGIGEISSAPWSQYRFVIKKVIVEEGITALCKDAFRACQSMVSVQLPDTLTVIPEWAFFACDSMTEIHIPASVESIGYYAFFVNEEINRLTTIRFLGDAPTIDPEAFAFVVATAYYPSDNSTWDVAAMQDYGGTLTWKKSGSEPEQPEAPVLETTTRLSGKGRCDTAIAAADALKQQMGVDKFESMILASGTNFADALAGSYLAAVKSAPIMLYQKGNEAKTVEYIAANTDKVYLLGGTGAVSAEVEVMLTDAGVTVQRLAGKSRYDTNLAILNEAGVASGSEILVATAYNFADSLSASATGKPILLVNSKDGKLTQAQQDYLTALGGAKITILGGKGAVSEALEEQLAAYGEVNRLAGKSRYDTSTLIAKTYFDNVSAVVVAYGKNFPDGLCGGPLAYVSGAPLLLTAAKAESAAAAYVAEQGVTAGYVLGGTGALSEETVSKVFGN